MSYNESYADKNIGDYAYGDGVDKGAATKYGDVFVEHTSQDLEAACDGVTCYVACSCKNNGPDDEDGWFSTIAEAQHGNPNAQVYTVTSDIHYSRDSVSTSSLNDLTIATASTTALANQTPISRASTLSSLTIDAPTLKTASTSGTKATCYKKVPCADGYFPDVPTAIQYEAITFLTDDSTGVTCYKPDICIENNNYGYTSTDTGKASVSYHEFICYEEQNCQDIDPGYYGEEPTAAQKSAIDIQLYDYTDDGDACYAEFGCNKGWLPTSYCDTYPSACGSSVVSYGTSTCYEDIRPDEIYFNVFNPNGTQCRFAADYTITGKDGSTTYSSSTIEGKSIILHTKCGDGGISTYSTTLYNTYDDTATFSYTCDKGNASLESISINGETYEDGDKITVDIPDMGTVELTVRLDFTNDDYCTPDKDYFDVQVDYTQSDTDSQGRFEQKVNIVVTDASGNNVTSSHSVDLYFDKIRWFSSNYKNSLGTSSTSNSPISSSTTNSVAWDNSSYNGDIYEFANVCSSSSTSNYCDEPGTVTLEIAGSRVYSRTPSISSKAGWAVSALEGTYTIGNNIYTVKVGNNTTTCFTGSGRYSSESSCLNSLSDGACEDYAGCYLVDYDCDNSSGYYSTSTKCSNSITNSATQVCYGAGRCYKRGTCDNSNGYYGTMSACQAAKGSNQICSSPTTSSNNCFILEDNYFNIQGNTNGAVGWEILISTDKSNWETSLQEVVSGTSLSICIKQIPTGTVNGSDVYNSSPVYFISVQDGEYSGISGSVHDFALCPMSNNTYYCSEVANDMGIPYNDNPTYSNYYTCWYDIPYNFKRGYTHTVVLYDYKFEGY